MIFRQHAAPLHARNDAKAKRDEALNRRARMTRAAAQPQERTLRVGERISELLDALRCRA